MFDFIDNEILKNVLEIISIIVGVIVGFLGGANYTKKKYQNKFGNVINSNGVSINQSINEYDKNQK